MIYHAQHVVEVNRMPLKVQEVVIIVQKVSIETMLTTNTNAKIVPQESIYLVLIVIAVILDPIQRKEIIHAPHVLLENQAIVTVQPLQIVVLIVNQVSIQN